MMSPRQLLCLLTLYTLVGVSVCTPDSFLEAAQVSCVQTKAPFSCLKYKGLLFLHKLATAHHRAFKFGPFQLVSLTDLDNTTTTFLSRAAVTDGYESEFLQIVKYGARQVDLFLRTHGLTVPLPSLGENGPSLIYDDGSQKNAIAQARGKKKKLALMLPLIALLKLGAIKMILLPILLGTLFIKKMVILAAMGLPSLLSILKICKISPPAHFYHQPAAYSTLDTPEDFSSYGAYHAKDWGTHPRMYG